MIKSRPTLDCIVIPENLRARLDQMISSVDLLNAAGVQGIVNADLQLQNNKIDKCLKRSNGMVADFKKSQGALLCEASGIAIAAVCSSGDLSRNDTIILTASTSICAALEYAKNKVVHYADRKANHYKEYLENLATTIANVPTSNIPPIAISKKTPLIAR